jgi:hypothetical protein
MKAINIEHPDYVWIDLRMARESAHLRRQDSSRAYRFTPSGLEPAQYP